MRSPGDEGEEAQGGCSTPGEFLDDSGEPEFLVGGEERGGGAEREGGDLDPVEDRRGVGEATDDLRLGPEVELDGVDDMNIDAALLAEAEVGIPPPADAVEEHGERKWSLHINADVGTTDTNDRRFGLPQYDPYGFSREIESSRKTQVRKTALMSKLGSKQIHKPKATS